MYDPTDDIWNSRLNLPITWSRSERLYRISQQDEPQEDLSTKRLWTGCRVHGKIVQRLKEIVERPS